MEKVKAEFELLGMQAKAAKLEEVDFIAWLINKGLPPEVVNRLKELFCKIQYIGGQAINIGKIIIMKLMQFVDENQHMVIGMAIGIGISVLASAMAAAVPLIGGLLSGIAFTITAFIVIPLGTLQGHRLDKALNGELTGDSLIADMITIARRFWELFVDIFSTIKDSMEEPKNV